MTGRTMFVHSLLVVAAGCGPGNGLVPVRGTAKLDGTPLSGAVVTFHAEPGTRGNGGSALTDGKGAFVMRSPQASAGVLPGTYRITVTCRRPTPEAERRIAEQVAAGLQPALSESDTKETLPRAYTQPDLTTLRHVVGSAGGVLDLDLDSSVAIPKPPSRRP